MTPAFLRTSFARKMLLLFLLGILAPGLVFGYLALRRVEAKFHKDSLRGMHFQSGEVAMSIRGGLESVDNHVKFLAGILENASTRETLSPQAWASLSNNRFLLGVTRIRGGSRADAIYGAPCPPPAFTPKIRAHLGLGNGLLYLLRGPAGR
ncbi:MAG: hypothetical protein IH611_08120, partial [Deltaproteobacteria bacterium]|nr:hypothetical protein [Deltaproteobacteria bacterium]